MFLFLNLSDKENELTQLETPITSIGKRKGKRAYVPNSEAEETNATKAEITFYIDVKQKANVDARKKTGRPKVNFIVDLKDKFALLRHALNNLYKVAIDKLTSKASDSKRGELLSVTLTASYKGYGERSYVVKADQLTDYINPNQLPLYSFIVVYARNQNKKKKAKKVRPIRVVVKAVFNFVRLEEIKVNKQSTMYKESNARVGTIISELATINLTASNIAATNRCSYKGLETWHYVDPQQIHYFIDNTQMLAQASAIRN